MTARWALVMIPDYVRANPHSIRSLLSMLLSTKDCLPLLRMLVHLYQANPGLNLAEEPGTRRPSFRSRRDDTDGTMNSIRSRNSGNPGLDDDKCRSDCVNWSLQNS